ncbi:hypothetical protein AB6A40_005875 [Gnathostoma spinigerum]|uniref:Transmembrane 9 superfamily member n=1 Tax=Gnathostoma spinigerum TaxID=75299 RepID=A0ABD6EP08_9BILA
MVMMMTMMMMMKMVMTMIPTVIVRFTHSELSSFRQRLSLIVVVIILALNDGVCGRKYENGDKVSVYVNKVGPYSNIHETYHYYTLPLCRPSKVVHKSLSLGQLLEGDRVAESSYRLLFGQNASLVSLCGPYTLSSDDTALLTKAIEEDYYFELLIDDIRVQSFVGYVREEETFPHKHSTFLFTHYIFRIYYNPKSQEIISVHLQMDPERIINVASDQILRIDMLYSVEWITTNDVERSKNTFFTGQTMRVQWMSVFNSVLLVIFLVSFISLIVASVLRRDIQKYNEITDDDLFLEDGWKTLSMDVFRPPPYINILCAVLGVGTQFVVLLVLILIFGSTNVVNMHRHEMLNTVVVVCYAVTSGVAGFTSAKNYRQFEGELWIRNVILTSCLFNVPMFVVWSINNTVSWAYYSTQALPYTTVIVLLLLWLFVGLPITVIGASLGRSLSSKYSSPCRIRNIPRQLPSFGYSHNLFCCALLGGLLPFISISVELYYIFATVWGREEYTLYYILLIVFVILMVVTATSTVSLIYFLLKAEDYRWWWRSVFSGGGLAIFIFLYGLHFLHSSYMSGFLQITQYFSHLLLICYISFLSLGTVGFTASQIFVRFIYSSVKTD